MKDELVNKIMDELTKKLGNIETAKPEAAAKAVEDCCCEADYLHKPLNIDVNWEVQVNMIINKWFSTTLTTNLMYDDDVKIAQKDGTKGSRVQFKEILGVGVQFNF